MAGSEWVVVRKGERSVVTDVLYKYPLVQHVHGLTFTFCAYVISEDQWRCHHCLKVVPDNYAFLAELVNCPLSWDTLEELRIQQEATLNEVTRLSKGLK